jgi:hypothetical protein
MSWIRVVAVASLAAMGLAGASLLATQEPDPSQADSLDKKIQDIRRRHEDGADQTKKFLVSEEEANAYLAYRLVEHLPEQVTAPWVRFGDGSVNGGAMLDLSLFGGRLSESAMTRYLTGQVPLEVEARAQANNGLGKVELQSVTLAGIPIPQTLIQELLTDHSKSPSRPNGVQLDDPFPLPYGIVSARFRAGKLVLRQGVSDAPAGSPSAQLKSNE